MHVFVAGMVIWNDAVWDKTIRNKVWGSVKRKAFYVLAKWPILQTFLNSLKNVTQTVQHQSAYTSNTLHIRHMEITVDNFVFCFVF